MVMSCSTDHRNSPGTETSLSLMNNSTDMRNTVEADKFLDFLLSHPNYDMAAIVANHSHRHGPLAFLNKRMQLDVHLMACVGECG